MSQYILAIISVASKVIALLNDYLWIGFEVVVEHMYTDGEVSRVERVGPVPALWTKLPPLNHHRMKVDQREQDTLEL